MEVQHSRPFPTDNHRAFLRHLVKRGDIHELALVDTTTARTEFITVEDQFDDLLRRHFVAIPETCRISHLLIQDDERSYLYRQLRASLDGVRGVIVVPSAGRVGFLRDPFIIVASLSPNAPGLVLRLGGNSDALLENGAAVMPSTFLREPVLTIEHDGGNFMVTPPTPRCPYGAIIVGQHGQYDVDQCRGAIRQQPIVVIDVNEGSVHHVDESLAFVGDRDGWAMVVPSRALANFLIVAAMKESSPLGWGRTRFTTGGVARGNGQITCQMRTLCFDRITSHMKASERAKQDEIYQRNGTKVTKTIGKAPTLFFPHVPGMHPNAMNLVTVNGRVLVPHQHTIRVSQEAAVRVLVAMFDNVNLPRGCIRRLPVKVIEAYVAKLATLHPMVQFHLREGQNLSIEQIAQTFCVDSSVDAVVADVIMELLEQTSSGTTRKATVIGPREFHLDAHGTVDILEACIFVFLSAMELDCRFIETSFLSYGGGNLHCATNRVPVLGDCDWKMDVLVRELLEPH